MKTIHISVLPIWDLGQGKGRVSTYLPLKTLCERGHEVRFLTTYKDQQTGTIVCGKDKAISVKKLRTILPHSKITYLNTLATCLNPLFCIAQSLIITLRCKPDVVYAHDIYSAITAFFLSKIARCKYVLKLYGIAVTSNYRKLLYMALKLPADLYVITNDGTSGKTIALKYGVSPDRICFWVNGIDKDWPDIPIDYELRKQISSGDENIILSLSRLANWKQVDVIIRALPEVVRRRGNVKLVVVGDGDQRKYLEKLAHNLGIADFVRFEGAVLHETALEYLRICDILVSMNALSSICNPVLEAMVCAKPVVALNTGTTTDLIKNNDSGIIIEVNETDRIPDCLLRLLEDDNLRRRIGRNSRNFILEKWPTWEQRTTLEALVIEALFSDGSTKFIRVKERADAILDIGRR